MLLPLSATAPLEFSSLATAVSPTRSALITDSPLRLKVSAVSAVVLSPATIKPLTVPVLLSVAISSLALRFTVPLLLSVAVTARPSTPPLLTTSVAALSTSTLFVASEPPSPNVNVPSLTSASPVNVLAPVSVRLAFPDLAI